jgi:tRNA nucleotidyltransferase (CCA-adding enzyme)
LQDSDPRAIDMSDYMFMLESHLSAIQNRAVALVQAAAASADVNLFLTGGAVRDMLGGFPIRDLDFTIEGNALKLAKAVEAKGEARVTAVDDLRKSAELTFPGGVTAGIAMAREERFPKIGARPVVTPATIHADLRCRDFSVNAIALSLNPASLGLLLDPNNGLADLEHKELRAVHTHVLYDDPGRMLRMIRFRVRFGFTLDERTQQQYDNVRLEELEKLIPARQLFEELGQVAEEANPGAVLQAFADEKLLGLFLPDVAGPKVNFAGFARLQKTRQLIPFGLDLRVNNLALFLYLLTEKLAPKEKAAFIQAAAVHKSEIDLVGKLKAAAKKLERELKSARITKASHTYLALSKAPGEEILFLCLTSEHRLVQDRIRHYLQKYLPAAQEITDRQVADLGAEPGTPKFKKLKEKLIVARVDGRTKKPAAPSEEPVPPPAPPAKGHPLASHARGK